ncbi:hypothetical protein COLO4_13810 [Corchorus olitorius]|uniref:Bet v I/Major latex protein domain-containing protein n=1 Tax=Corchorus olitorius TaxID=93759 RepID=A0A1R3JUR3_9ROSI|nr:hypothetical protein COLO4_13810 [Corchorus olitorius]
MGISTFTEEFVSPVPAQKLFKALALDNDKLLPQLIPQAIKSIETIQGDGGSGPQLKHLKQRIDGIDKEKMTFSYTFIEGDALIDKVESISHEIKIILKTL